MAVSSLLVRRGDDLGEALAHGRDHLIPRRAFGDCQNPATGPRHGGPPAASDLVEQHRNADLSDVEFGDLAHGLLACGERSPARRRQGLPGGSPCPPA
jgi:hypothetical protein